MGIATEVEPAEVDEITRRVRDMYSRFPYPSVERREQRLKELANLQAVLPQEPTTGERRCSMSAPGQDIV